MSRRKIKPQPKNKQIRRERASLPFKYTFLTVICGLILLAGFFGAARQHFVSIEYGIKNSKLRKQIEALESEKRSLINARETALAPSEIIKAAKKYGFAKIQNVAEVLPSENEDLTTEKVSVKKTSDQKQNEDSKTKVEKSDEKKAEKKLTDNSKTGTAKKDEKSVSEKPAKDSDTSKKGEK